MFDELESTKFTIFVSHLLGQMMAMGRGLMRTHQSPLGFRTWQLLKIHGKAQFLHVSTMFSGRKWMKMVGRPDENVVIVLIHNSLFQASFTWFYTQNVTQIQTNGPLDFDENHPIL